MRTISSVLHPRPGGSVTAVEAVIIVVVVTCAAVMTTVGFPAFGVVELLAAALYLACRVLATLRHPVQA
ncbi:hypothetical protein DEJ46_31900 [Streptomyces venezuelae]|uniref:Uncharacterized protein n=1 Tax=Streptomyces venezuelae TaxID=54571 RepID=A0A5P2AYC9_STRVZ|nr:hypothetical protein DEJ46_31900 [Streptomyces venezuelae]